MNDIEEKFYKVFNIKPHENKMPYGEWEYYYPEITDRILLELICIYSGLPDVEYQKHFLDVDNMKKYILGELINNINTSGGYYKRQVQSLFTKEEE